MPTALVARDYHSLWLNTAGLARAGGDLGVAGGVVELDEAGEPTGVLREEAAWRFKDRYLAVSDDEYVAAMREALPVAASRGVPPSMTRTAGSARSGSGSGSSRQAR